MHLSIIIPVYNVEKYIKRCIDSIIDQENHNLVYEIIAVNDGSKDNSSSVLDSYKNNTVVQTINQENKGAGTARNVGIENAKGNYIWFIDSDDYIEKNSFSSLETEILNNTIDLIAFDYYLVNETKKERVELKLSNNQSINQYFVASKSLFLWKNIYKASIINDFKIRFIEGIKNIEDFQFNIQVLMYAQTFLYKNIYLYNYFENITSTSRDISASNLKKLASDSYVVHSNLKTLLSQNNNLPQEEIINDLLNKSIVGFFYSLFRFKYTYKELLEYYNIYTNNKMLPVTIKNANKKFKFFKFFVNNKFLFLTVSFFKKQ